MKTTDMMIKEAITQLMIAESPQQVMQLTSLILTLQADKIRELEQDKANLIRQAA